MELKTHLCYNRFRIKMQNNLPKKSTESDQTWIYIKNTNS